MKTRASTEVELLSKTYFPKIMELLDVSSQNGGNVILCFDFFFVYIYLDRLQWKAKSFEIPEDPSQSLPERSPMGPF